MVPLSLPKKIQPLFECIIIIIIIIPCVVPRSFLKQKPVWGQGSSPFWKKEKEQANISSNTTTWKANE